MQTHSLVTSTEDLGVLASQSDAQDIVVAANEVWRASAHAHGRLDLAPHRVLGQSLWHGRTSQLGEGWHRSENSVRFWVVFQTWI